MLERNQIGAMKSYSWVFLIAFASFRQLTVYSFNGLQARRCTLNSQFKVESRVRGITSNDIGDVEMKDEARDDRTNSSLFPFGFIRNSVTVAGNFVSSARNRKSDAKVDKHKSAISDVSDIADIINVVLESESKSTANQSRFGFITNRATGLRNFVTSRWNRNSSKLNSISNPDMSISEEKGLGILGKTKLILRRRILNMWDGSPQNWTNALSNDLSDGVFASSSFRMNSLGKIGEARNISKSSVPMGKTRNPVRWLVNWIVEELPEADASFISDRLSANDNIPRLFAQRRLPEVKTVGSDTISDEEGRLAPRRFQSSFVSVGVHQSINATSLLLYYFFDFIAIPLSSISIFKYVDFNYKCSDVV